MMFVAPARVETPICKEHIDLLEKKKALGSFCFGLASACIVSSILLTECEHFETNTWQFVVFGQASACIVSWILLTEWEHLETNTWQFLFWSGDRRHRALDSTH